MQLIVKQGNLTANEFRFNTGPIRIGRQPDSQIFLSDRRVSREHAVIFNTDDGKWVVEDLDSSSKTYLNKQAVRKSEIKTGDLIQISDFTIEIKLEDGPGIQNAIHLDDTFTNLEASIATPPHEIIVRKPDAGHAPAMRLSAKRLTDFSQATEEIAKADSLDKLLITLLNVMVKQFSAFHAWCALREQPNGPMTYHAGKRRDGQHVQLSEIKLQDKINQVIEKGQFLVMPRVAAKVEAEDRIRSALIASIMRQGGCYGVLYIDNAMIHEHYGLSDLDYLMLIAIH
ncbi:MAG: FHA domain-containing protein, partial [Planctomycetota bacterium]|nr:FHA domain-containing protein [Planctomycetota bacterium]